MWVWLLVMGVVSSCPPYVVAAAGPLSKHEAQRVMDAHVRALARCFPEPHGNVTLRIHVGNDGHVARVVAPSARNVARCVEVRLRLARFPAKRAASRLEVEFPERPRAYRDPNILDK